MTGNLRRASRRMAGFLVLVLAAGWLSVSVEGQRRAIRGRITDASGAAVPGVTVALVVNGRVERTAVTRSDGWFAFDADVPRDGLEVRIELPGLAPRTLAIPADSGRAAETFAGYRVEVRAMDGATAAAAPRRSPPPPPPPPPETAPPPATAPPIVDPNTHATIPVFYATDRNRVSYTPLAYGGDREPARQLHLGRIDVSVPRDHQMGQLERPTIWTLWREDPTKHFIVVNAKELPYADFYRDVGSVVARSQRKEAFVFVHGFNVTFESAVYRTAQVAYDLGFDGAPILYSWPSLGSATGYPTDANNSEWTVDRLHWFLEDVAARSGATYIHVIAHSRGNFPAMSALNAIATEPHTGARARFSQIVLTAPDVDADTFKVLARRFRDISERTTLYASANDEALSLSKRYQGYQRAGDVRPQIVIADGVDSIDVSSVDTSFLGHSYYGDNTSVISDIGRLLRTGLSPERRCGIQAFGDALLRYWVFVARSVCPVSG